jgi:hypothetical protein
MPCNISCRRFLLGCAIFTLILIPAAFPQEKSNNNPQLYRLIPPSAPTSGYRAEFLEQLSYYEQRYTRLAEAIPAEKYSWRPADGVRATGELVANAAVANVLVTRSLEGPLKPGVYYGINSETVMKNTMAVSGDKAKVLQELKNSFNSLRTEVLLLKDGEADKSQKLFGKETTLRGAFLLIAGYWGEHLGQLTAYARMTGIAPPWAEKSPQD